MMSTSSVFTGKFIEEIYTRHLGWLTEDSTVQIGTSQDTQGSDHTEREFTTSFNRTDGRDDNENRSDADPVFEEAKIRSYFLRKR
jgi:hypothetical protein